MTDTTNTDAQIDGLKHALKGFMNASAARHALWLWTGSQPARYLALYLMDVVGALDSVGVVHVTTLMRELRMSTRTTMSAFKELEDAGVLTIERRPARPSFYTLHSEKILALEKRGV